MIKSKKDLKEYLIQDAKANGRTTIKPRIINDFPWKCIYSLRKAEYYMNKGNKILKLYWLSRLSKYCIKCCYSIPTNVCGPGLALVHRGTIIINHCASIGNNCRILDGVNIGATNGSSKAPRIGNNVFIGSGAKIIGDLEIADDVCIAAGAVVVKSILEKGTTWGGVPAKKISNNNSHSNLCRLLELDKKESI